MVSFPVFPSTELGNEATARPAGAVCRRATVGVKFSDGQATLSHVLSTLEDIPPHEARPFEVKAFAPSAKVFDTTVELAQY